MLLSKQVNVKWNSKIKKHYEGKGYKYTKMGDEFNVSVNDLTDGSNVYVLVKCDYCGCTYQKQWHRYITESKETIQKDCCMKCKKYKIIDTAQCKYGVNTVFRIPKIKEQIKQTNLIKYRVTNPFANDEIKNKIYETNKQKYGFTIAMKNKDVQKKAQNTCLKKYGVKSFTLTMNLVGENSPRWKGGVKYHRVERATLEYVAWRKLVFSRDSFQCQCCGNKNGNGKTIKLNAHHIFNWKDNPELRYSVENGITLCENCHNLFHHNYGKKNNNNIQLSEFLND